MRSLRLGFAGTPEFAVPTLDALSRSQHRILAVFTQPDRPVGRGRVLQAGPVKRRALELGLTTSQPVNFKTDAQAALSELALDALVVVAYGLILPATALAMPRLGCFNVHASLLPRWRGAAPIQRALMAGDAVTGVTIMRMEAGLDTGPMLVSRALDIGDADTSASLHDRLARSGAELMAATVEAMARNELRTEAQSEVGATYAHKLDKTEASIDWASSALAISRQVRALNPWPVAETTWEGVQVRIWQAKHDTSANADAAPAAAPGSVLQASAQGIDVRCGQGVLRLLRLQLAGRNIVAAGDFARGRSVVGARFGREP